MREAGIPDSEIGEYLGEPESFGIHPKNHEAVGWFMAMQRRWIVSDTGHRQRFDDQAIAAQMQLRGLPKKKRARLLDALMIMESAALEELNKQAPSPASGGGLGRG